MKTYVNISAKQLLKKLRYPLSQFPLKYWNVLKPNENNKLMVQLFYFKL